MISLGTLTMFKPTRCYHRCIEVNLYDNDVSLDLINLLGLVMLNYITICKPLSILEKQAYIHDVSTGRIIGLVLTRTFNTGCVAQCPRAPFSTGWGLQPVLNVVTKQGGGSG